MKLNGRTTAAAVAALITANVDKLYESPRPTPPLDWQRFHEEQRRLWDFAKVRGERFNDKVAMMLCPLATVAPLATPSATSAKPALSPIS